MIRLSQLPLCGLLVLALGASPLHAWWNKDWPVRQRITVDPAAAGSTDPVGGMAVVIRLHDGNYAFADSKPDGSDLRFVAEDDKTLLPFHVEKIDPLLNEAFVWVRVPDLKARTTIWLYHGNQGGTATRADDAKATYDAETVLVYHFAEKGSPAADSSGKGNNAQVAGSPTEGSIIGSGLQLEGRTMVTIPGSASLAWAAGAPMTWSAWIKPGVPQANAALFTRMAGLTGFVLGADSGVPYVELVGMGTSQRSSAAAVMTPNAWHHLAVVAEPAKITLYLDGEVYSTLAAALPALDGPMLLGGRPGQGAAAGNSFVGEIDELEIAQAVRSPAWIRFATNQQGGGEKANRIAEVAEVERPKSWLSWLETGYVGIILQSLSFDGWVVIGVLAVMFIISWIVMIGKVRYLSAVGAGNERFLREWRQVSTDLSVIDHESDEHVKSMGGRVDAKADVEVMRNAPLFRIYHVGVVEIRRRLAADRSIRVLSARSIQAIRAALDGTLVRETHRLSAQMVLLTIAISGGPFLGLLGTVVGVMITFAAVAAAGDVNVNAIAPGIAAALAATVAGLAVAIPALFGYNYLLTRVKAATSDMHVFIDEFVAKMAEFYSEAGDANRPITRAPFAPSEPTVVTRK